MLLRSLSDTIGSHPLIAPTTTDPFAARHHPHRPSTREPSPHPEDLTHELYRIIRLSLPLAATNLCSFGISVATISFVGHLGQNEYDLAAAILATSVFNVTGFSLVQGLNSALETFCGQAWGAANYPAIGLVLQRALTLNFFLVAFVSLLWGYGAPSLLLLLGQDPIVAASASRFLSLLIPALFFSSIFEALKRYLAVQGHATASAVVTITSLSLSFLYNYVLIFTLGLGLVGAALAVDAVQATMALSLLLYAVYVEHGNVDATTRTWPGWSLSAVFHGPSMMAFIRQAIPSVLMLIAEWWTFEILVLFSGWLPNPQVSLSVMGVCLNLSAFIWSAVGGIALACSARISGLLGSQQPHRARQSAIIALALGVAVECIAVVGILLTRQRIGIIFTRQPTIIACIASIMPIFVISLPGDGANCVLQGLLRGSGNQALGSIVNLCSYWLLGLPVSYYLGHVKGLGVAGLWWGLGILNIVQGVVMLVVCFGGAVDFEREAVVAAERSAALLSTPLIMASEDDVEDG